MDTSELSIPSCCVHRRLSINIRNLDIKYLKGRDCGCFYSDRTSTEPMHLCYDSPFMPIVVMREKMLSRLLGILGLTMSYAVWLRLRTLK